ncbi:VPLPA-CTERM sorting domain-containing protein [Parvularcula maris]|uniref:VPLPA-CTERM sorting domain-containing protein n=1 Tax=Parvularcula maris TaxID=2965077 RepID=A0A9X2L8T5_9PROT|nr:VPLPA-CTERM sorting domain-containing protein [Parvularcula maris]MCQ8185198.1 VPLPA-CTERM sorting domain-containing protein [Parvularcula maris]
MKHLLASAAALATLLGANAGAAIVSAEADCDITGTNPNGIQCGTNDRRDLSNVEFSSTGDGDFFSLGLGGSATFEVDPAFNNGGVMIEVTNGSRSNYVETVTIAVSADNITFTDIGTFDNSQGLTSFSFNVPGGPFSFIRFTDETTGIPNGDGFDIDAFSVQAVPVPAAALLMPLGLAALARRKRKA